MYLGEIADTASAIVHDTMQFVEHLLAAFTFVSIIATRLQRKFYRWIHHYTRLDGLQMFANATQKPNHVEKDPELGGTLPRNPATTKKSRILIWWSNSLVRVIVYLMMLGMIIYSAFILLHVLIYASPPQVVERAINQIDFTHLMHTRHSTTDDPLELAATHDFLGIDDASETIVPYGDVGIAVFTDRTMLPPHVAEPCRRLSKKELLSGITLEGYEIPILLVRMCDIVHNLVGCDDAGHIIPKMLNTTDDLNVCIITYKDAGGVCSHYINPTVREVVSSVTQEVVISSPHLPFLGEHPIQLRTQGLLTYQPIVEEQIAHDASPEQPIGAIDIAMSEALEKVKDVTHEQWLPILPKIVTISLTIPRIYHFHIAHEGLQGNYPNVLALNAYTTKLD